jgi:DNA-binding PadR family transcriptional regulator
MGKDQLGQLEEMSLLAVLHLQGDAYGAEIQREIAERTGRRRTISAIYVTLVRLQEKGFVESVLADPTPVRGGKAKRLFTVTAAGIEALDSSRRAMQGMWKGLELPPGGTK